MTNEHKNQPKKVKKISEALQQEDFMELKQVLLTKYHKVEEEIIQNAHVYLHNFRFPIKGNAKDMVEGNIKFLLTKNGFNNEIFTIDWNFFVNGVYAETNDAYYYINKRDELKEIIEVIAMHKRKMMDRDLEGFLLLDKINSKFHSYGIQALDDELAAKYEENYFKVLQREDYKNKEKELDGMQKEKELEMVVLVKQFEEQNWKRAIDLVLENNDLEGFKKLMKMKEKNELKTKKSVF